MLKKCDVSLGRRRGLHWQIICWMSVEEDSSLAFFKCCRYVVFRSWLSNKNAEKKKTCWTYRNVCCKACFVELFTFIFFINLSSTFPVLLMIAKAAWGGSVAQNFRLAMVSWAWLRISRLTSKLPDSVQILGRHILSCLLHLFSYLVFYILWKICKLPPCCDQSHRP